MKRQFQCVGQKKRDVSPTLPNTAPATTNKWTSWLTLGTYATLFTMRGATCVIVQPLQKLKEICWKRMKAKPHVALRVSFQISPNTAPSTESAIALHLNTGPATKRSTHHWFSSHVKRYKCHCPNSQNTAPATKNDRVLNLIFYTFLNFRQCHASPLETRG